MLVIKYIYTKVVFLSVFCRVRRKKLYSLVRLLRNSVLNSRLIVNTITNPINSYVMKKYVAELIGTMVLVLLGCGSAVFAGGMADTVGADTGTLGVLWLSDYLLWLWLML